MKTILSKNIIKNFDISTMGFNIQNDNVIPYIVRESKSLSFSDRVEKLIEDNIEKPFVEIIENIEDDALIISENQEEIIKKYLILIYMRSCFYFDSINSNFNKEKEISTLEKDLNALVRQSIPSLCRAKNIGDRLRFFANQANCAYLLFWKSFTHSEFFENDLGYAISTDLSPGVKLTYLQSVIESEPENEMIKSISESLDYMPMNFLLFPIKKDLCIVLSSPFMKLYTQSYKPYRPVFSIFTLTWSNLYNDTFEEPVKENGNIVYTIKDLSQLETLYCNELIIDDAQKLFFWTDTEGMKGYFFNYKEKPNNKHDIDVLISKLY